MNTKKEQVTFYISSTIEELATSKKPFRTAHIESEICKEQRISTQMICDTSVAIEKSKGRIGPRDFVMEGFDGTIMYNYFDLIAWIERNGLRLI